MTLEYNEKKIIVGIVVSLYVLLRSGIDLLPTDTLIYLHFKDLDTQVTGFFFWCRERLNITIPLQLLRSS
jgi:hypothetical protein